MSADQQSMHQRMDPLRDGLPPRERLAAMCVIFLGLTLAVLDGSIVTLALPTIARELQSSASDAVWVVNAYQIGSMVMMLPLSALGERIGYRKVYLGGMLLFSLASIASMMAPSMSLLLVARVLQGVGAAGIVSVNSALVRLIFPNAMLGKGIAINSLVVAGATMAGPAVAAGILSVASWHWLFALNIPLGIFTWWLGNRSLPPNPSSQTALEPAKLTDIVLNGLMFLLFFLGANQLREMAIGNSPWLGVTLLGLAVAVGWYYINGQRREARPLFPVDLLRIPVFALSMCASFFAFSAQTMAFICLPFLLLEVYHLNASQAGLLMSIWPVATVMVAPLAGRLIGRFSGGLLGGIGMGLFFAGLLALSLMGPAPALWDIAWRMLVCGAGFALFQSPNNHTIVTSAPISRSGAAGGMLSTARLTGQTIGAILLSVIFAMWPEHSGEGEQWALGIASVLALLAAVFSMSRGVHLPAKSAK